MTNNWIKAEDLREAADLLEDLESFMTPTIAEKIPNDAPAKLVRILEDAKAIRVFRMNVGHKENTYFALAVR